MLMASHIYLALRSRSRPVDGRDLGAYLSGAIAPDIRYLRADLPRATTHSWDLGRALTGPFGHGYRHHLAVDDAFYRRCEEQPVLRRLGAMNVTILAELHALRRVEHVPRLELPAELTQLTEAGISGESLGAFVTMSNEYLESRDIDRGIRLLTGPLKERAGRYLSRWNRWGGYLKGASLVAGPALETLFGSILPEADAAAGGQVR